MQSKITHQLIDNWELDLANWPTNPPLVGANEVDEFQSDAVTQTMAQVNFTSVANAEFYDWMDQQIDLNGVLVADAIEDSFKNDPQYHAEMMFKEADPQFIGNVSIQQPIDEVEFDSSVYMSPPASNPASPTSFYMQDQQQQQNCTNVHFAADLALTCDSFDPTDCDNVEDLDSTTAMTIFDEILNGKIGSPQSVASEESLVLSTEEAQLASSLQELLEGLNDEHVDDEPVATTSKSLPRSRASKRSRPADKNDDPDFEPSSSSKAPKRKQVKRSDTSEKQSVSQPTDRKTRKKGQNRNAALKYRMKKKLEENLIDDEAAKLEKVNSDLKEQLGKLESEKSYLKGLLIEICQAKGIRIKF